jgi:hypothetical protein
VYKTDVLALTCEAKKMVMQKRNRIPQNNASRSFHASAPFPAAGNLSVPHLCSSAPSADELSVRKTNFFKHLIRFNRLKADEYAPCGQENLR